MPPLREVEEAKSVMTQALEWSVLRWLKEKKRVRKLADRANEALDRSIEQTRLSWSPELQATLAQLRRNGNSDPRNGNELLRLAREFQRAHEAARRAREDAETTFDDAEKQLSARLAREGCRKAILSWELHEKVIRKAESAGAH